MQTSTFGLKFDSLRYDVPLKIRSRSSKHNKLFKLSQWYAQTTTYWFIRYHACTQEREWGSGTLILTLSLTESAQKYVPPPLEWGEIKRVVHVWRQTKPNVAASKNGRKKGKIKLSFATIECNVWQNAGVHFSLLFSKLLCILFAHTCLWSIVIYVPISCKMPCEWRNSFNLVDLYP